MYAMGARRKRINAPAALGHHLGIKGERPMRTLAPNSPNVQSEIDDAFIGAFIKFACPPLFDPLAGMDLSNLFKDVKPMPRRRHRAWNNVTLPGLCVAPRRPASRFA
jgi:hypothetical protein